MKMKRFLSLLMTFCMVLTLLPVGASAATEKHVEFTVDSLGLEALKYTAGTTTVSGVAVEWVQLGNYGNGIQMRDKADKGTSMLWNTSAMGAGITKIELTYSATQEVKYANADAVIFNFGYSAQGASYSTKLSTTADVKTYTITPNADTYTYFYMEHDLAYTFYWDSIKVYYKESEPGDHVSAPELVDGYYEIFTADQLYWFAEKVNGGDTAINGKLMADIAVNENVLKEDGTLNGDGSNFRVWTPIGNSSERYAGTFDGNGKTVSGLYFNDTSVDCIGLFGEFDSGGKVQNVGILDSFLCGNYHVGGLVGFCFNGTIRNCFNSGTIIGTGAVGGVVGCADVCTYVYNSYNNGSVSGNGSVGGVIGSYNEGGTIIDCYNSGTIRGDDSVGGVVGSNHSGGFVSNCYNTGSISGIILVGGVVGYNAWGTVTESYNTGTISASGNDIGGVVGKDYNGTINNCYNAGNVNGNTNIGGIVGSKEGDSVKNCHNVGNVSGTTNVTAVVGAAFSCTVSNCYYISGCSNAAGFGILKSVAQFASGEVAYLLQGDQTEQIWGQTIGTDAYPVLGGEIVFCDGDYYNCTHSWSEATCFAPKTCMVCGTTTGSALGHSYENGFCVYCDVYEPAVLNGDVYEISNAGQLYWFAAKVNGGDTAINGKLMADIVVNENVLKEDGTLNGDGSNFRVWTPIGNSSERYAGTFDGNGKTVSGLYFNDTSANYVGLFGWVNFGGVVKNVGVGGSYFSGSGYVGGVVGLNYGTVSECYNTGRVNASYYVGGVVGYSDESLVSNCYNTGSVSGDDRVGGVVGGNYGTVIDCYNNGSVSGNWKVGSVVGYNFWDSTVSNCYNTGSVSGDDCAGGVVGENDGAVSNSYNTGSVSGGDYIGGVVGYNSDGTVDNCYYLNDCLSADNGYGSAMTAQQFASGEVAYLLQGDQTEDVWGQAIGTDAYPVLGGAKVYKNQIGGCNADSYTYEYSNTQATAVVTHNWTDATCTKPSTCTHCNVTSGDPLGHDWKAATCADPKTCNRCGLTEGNALGHKWSDATCTTAKTCSVCGTTSGKPLGHKWSDATCTTAKTCSVCGTTSGKPLGHKWEWITTVEPTCTESGVYAEVCEFCGAVSESTELPARGHYYHHEVTAQPTCTEYGIVTHTCTVCGDTYSDSRMVNLDEVFMYALREFDAGEWDAWPIVSELWTVLNPEHSYNCNINNCFKYLSAEEYEAWIDRYIDADDDMLSKIREYGYDPDTNTYMLYHVYMGGYIYGRAYMGYVDNGGTYTVFFEDREYETLPEEARYIIDGYLEAEEDLPDTITYKGKVYEHIGCAEYVYTVSYKGTGNKYDVEYDGNTVRILSWGTYGPEDKPAEFDHGKYPNLEPIGHNYQAVVTAPGCLSDGYTTHTCLNCGDSYTTDFVLGTGHSWINATCTEPMTCAVCKVTVGNALGHNWKDGSCIEPKTCTTCGIMQEMGNHNYQAVVTAPGCMSDGYTTYTCSLCGHSYRDDYVLATGHSWVSASCTEPMHCVNCGVTVGTELGHNYVDSVCTICGHQLPAIGVTVTGTVTSYLTDGDVTVELLRGGEVVHSIVVHGKTVEYNFESVMAGTYTLRVSKENHTTREYAITVGEQDMTADATICPVGDVTGDGVVNIKDFQRLLRHVNRTNSLTGYELACGDVTGDGTCNIKDFQRLLRHINKTNPLF